MTATAPSLPALPTVRASEPGGLPCIVIDTREQEPLPIRRLPTVRAGLLTADYSLAGLEAVFGIERKSIADLVACCAASNRERFENELHRLRGYHFKRLLIVGTRREIEDGAYRSRITPAAVLGTLAAFEVRYEIPVVFEPDPEAAARRVECWGWYFAREHVQSVNALMKTASEVINTVSDKKGGRL
jgi:DNA excision repair protein ERCC-4